MRRPVLWTAFVWALMAGMAGAQENPEEKKAPVAAVVELLEDGTSFFIEHLDNHGGSDASVVEKSEQGAFSGVCSLSVTSFQRFNTRMPGWNYKIVKDPQPGQYRYLRFAWKRSEAPGIMLQIHTKPNAWHRYFAGTVSEQTQSWGAMTRVGDAVPRKWELVTRDLFTDFGPMTITGVGFSALEGSGAAYYDHIYLGRTIEELDHVTAVKKNVAIPEPDAVPQPDLPARRPWLFWAIVGIVLISLIGFLGVVLIVWLRGPKAVDKETPGKPSAKPTGKPSPRKLPGAKASKPNSNSPEM